MVDLKTLRQLIRLMVDNDLTELDIQAEGGPVKIKRNSQGTVTNVIPAGVMQAAPMHAAPASAVPAAPSAQPVDKGVTIDSPMVGTFYSASSPDAKPFANVGDRVDEDSVVCIIEAMKVFNEIKAEVSGVIDKILVDNGQAVEFGQPLFTVKPD